MPEPLLETLWKAVKQKKVCTVKYNNESAERIIHPYGVCKVGKSPIVVVCWQEKGDSQSSHLPNYRNLPLNKCQSVEILDRSFQENSSFNPEDGLYQKWMFRINI
jgi:predicted DNA-binding transcriptional regulator YafY